MNEKVIVLMLVCMAVAVSAAGCMANESAAAGRSAVSQKTAYDYSGINAAPASAESVYMGANGYAPAPTPVPAMVRASSSGSSAAVETKIIKTASVTIEVQDVTGSVETLRSLVTAKGGYLSSSSVSEGYNKRLSGTVVLRVPASEFDNTLAGVKAIGAVKSVSTQGQDVTEEYVDILAQKTSYQNQLAQYNEIMKKAQKVSDVIEIQQQIDRVQTELNRLEGRLKYLNSRIDLSTITVSLQEPEPIGGETGPSFISALNEGIAGFFGMIYGIIVLLLTLLPLVILGLVVYGAYRWKKGKEPQKVPAEPAEKK